MSMKGLGSVKGKTHALSIPVAVPLLGLRVLKHNTLVGLTHGKEE